MNIKYAIFDLDGTLLDTIESLIKTGNSMLKELGYEPRSNKEFRKFIGYGAKELVRQLIVAAGDEEAKQLEEAYKIYMQLFEEYCVYKVEPYPGILELIAAMQERNIPLAVLTNKPHQMTGRVLATTFSEDTFAYVLGQSTRFPRKPDPTAAHYIAEKLGAKNIQEVIMIGDSDADIQTAKNAKMLSAGAAWGFRGSQELIDNECDILLEKPTDLIQHL